MLALNPGGFIGDLLPIFAVGIFFVVSISSGAKLEAIELLSRWVVAAIVIGAFIGNFLWERFVAKANRQNARDRSVGQPARDGDTVPLKRAGR